LRACGGPTTKLNIVVVDTEEKLPSAALLDNEGKGIASDAFVIVFDDSANEKIGQ
jgi:hypothetical protein